MSEIKLYNQFSNSVVLNVNLEITHSPELELTINKITN
jgi:hypothetical protein